jgi:hypothetical protein
MAVGPYKHSTGIVDAIELTPGFFVSERDQLDLRR